MMMTRKFTRAFSLVELSIVLVILGLLVGGILAGQSLIRAGELRAVPVEHAKLQTALSAFKDKYFALPGDMANATSFWGAVNTTGTNGNCGAPASDTGTGTQTCNGDGNTFIGTTSATTYGSAYRYELFRLWQHLANAGLIEGSYTGVTGSGGTEHYIPGTNTLASKIAGAGWALSYAPASAGGTSDFPFEGGTYMQLGKASATASPNGKAFTPAETWNIDKKMDDGKPGAGRVSIKYWDDCTLAATKDDVTGDYDLTQPDVQCALKFYRFL